MDKENHVAATVDKDVSLAPYKTGPNSMAWRASEPDAPSLFALVSCEHGMAVPLAPETDIIIIAIFDDGVVETLGSIEIVGRDGLIAGINSMLASRPIRNPTGRCRSCSSSTMSPAIFCSATLSKSEMVFDLAGSKYPN